MPATVLGTRETVVTGSVLAFLTVNTELSASQSWDSLAWGRASVLMGSPGAEPTLFQDSARQPEQLGPGDPVPPTQRGAAGLQSGAGRYRAGTVQRHL